MATLTATLTITAALLSAWETPSLADPLPGVATYYAPGLMATVARNRGHILWAGDYRGWLQREGLVGGVALNAKGDLGRRVWLEWEGQTEGPYLAIDCAQLRHYGARLDAQRVVEVDYSTAQRLGFAGIGPRPVVVHFAPPWVHNKGCPDLLLGQSQCEPPRSISGSLTHPVYHRIREAS